MNEREVPTSPVAEFLLARIADDEAAARATPPGFSQRESFADRFSTWESDHSVEDAASVDRFDPARVLAECEAKRRLLDLTMDDFTDDPSNWTANEYLRLLALPYADHPDYRDEWRP